MSARLVTVNMDSSSSVMVTLVCAPSAVMSMVSSASSTASSAAVTIVATDVSPAVSVSVSDVHRVVGSPLGRRPRQRQRDLPVVTRTLTPPVDTVTVVAPPSSAIDVGAACHRQHGLVVVGDGDRIVAPLPP